LKGKIAIYADIDLIVKPAYTPIPNPISILMKKGFAVPVSISRPVIKLIGLHDGTNFNGFVPLTKNPVNMIVLFVSVEAKIARTKSLLPSNKV
jgi:hypothetical protein